jgi:prepilin-type N-terminal cleavage/methylation domain-containing protein
MKQWRSFYSKSSTVGCAHQEKSDGFSLIEVAIGMVILGVVLFGLASFAKTQRNGLYKENQQAIAIQGATYYTERQKTWFADTTKKSGGKTRFQKLYAAVGASYVDSTWSWTPASQGATTYSIRIHYTQIAGVDSLLKARGTVTWNTSHVFRWGTILGKQ